MKRVLVLVAGMLFVACAFSHSVFAEQGLTTASLSGDAPRLSVQTPQDRVSQPANAAGETGVRKEQANSVLANRGAEAAGSGKTYTDPATGMKFVLVKGGCYAQGVSGVGDGEGVQPMHKVCVDDYYLGEFEVTQSQWLAIMGSNPAGFGACGSDCPVESVSWNDAQKFIQALNRKTGKNYRLPTEAEWEYAARSGGKGQSGAVAGTPAGHIDAVAFGHDFSRGVHPVEQTHPNGLGIYGMSGSLWEWTADWYSSNASYYHEGAVANPTGPSTGLYRTLRGGSWIDKPKVVASSFRIRYEPWVRRTWIGFRLASPGSGELKQFADASADK